MIQGGHKTVQNSATLIVFLLDRVKFKYFNYNSLSFRFFFYFTFFLFFYCVFKKIKILKGGHKTVQNYISIYYLLNRVKFK